MKLTQSDIRRFWEKVDRKGPDECWEWLAATNTRGYGRFWLNGRMEGSNRVAWILTHGAIPEHILVCHKCDNPPCCNPSHLFVGTAKDNTADMIRKGRRVIVKTKRYRRGEEHPSSKLTWKEVRLIRALHADRRKTTYALAAEFGVSRPTICAIIHNKSWHDPSYSPTQEDFRHTRSGPGR